MRLPPPILALTPGTLIAGDLPMFLERARRASERCLRGVVLRERGLADGAFLELALELRHIFLRESGGWLALHDRPHLALAADADAVHLGGRSLAPASVRSWLPREVALGLSTHMDDDPSTWLGADYVVHGPVRATRKGADPLQGIGFDALARAVRRAKVPVWALGGMGPEDAADCVRSGASGIAALGGILARPDAAERAASFLRAWSQAAETA